MAAERRSSLVQVYTGNGKGKTTAAWGQAFRAYGQGLNVCVVRFLKPGASGEVAVAGLLNPVLPVYGETSPYDASVDQRCSEKLKTESVHNLRLAARLVASGEYDLVVLDEINNVIDYGFILDSDVLKLIDSRPPHVSLVLTGRYAPASIIESADLVTEMVDVKHPYYRGCGASRGIEF